MEHEELDRFLREALSHANAQVRLRALERIEARGLRSMGTELRRHLAQEKDPVARGRVLRTLCAVEGADVFDLVFPYLSDPHPDVRRGALVGFIRSEGADGVLAAGEHINRYLSSGDPEERRLAAEVLGESEMTNFYQPLLPLLEDPAATVRRAALRAAGRLANPRLIPRIAALLAHTELRETAATALVAFGDAALPELGRVLGDEAANWRDLHRVVRVVGRIGTPRATGLLCDALEHDSWLIRSAVYEALAMAGSRIDEDGVGRVERAIGLEAERTTWCRAALRDVSAGRATELVARALGGEIRRSQDNLLFLLSCVYARAPIMAAKRGLRSDSTDVQAQAIEILDTILTSKTRTFVIPLLDDARAEADPTSLHRQFPQQHLAPDARLAQLLSTEAPVGVWTRLCALYVIGRVGMRALESEVRAALNDQAEVIRETARWASERLEREEGALDTDR